MALLQTSGAGEPASARSEEGANPFFAFCMDTHDSRKRTLRQQAELLKELGYSGAGHLWLKNVRARLRTLDEAGLKLFQIYIRVNVAPGERPYDPKLKETIPLLKGRGVTLAVLMNGLPRSDTAGDPRAVEIIREIADMGRGSGVGVALYPHAGYWLERVEDAVRVAKKVDRANVGVMLNLCHWLKVDGEKKMKPLLTSAMPYLSAVSINGADSAADVRGGKGSWIQPLDSGSFDVYALLGTLKDLGYKGPVGLQCWGIRGDARDHLARSMAAWRRLGERLAAPGRGSPK